MASVACVVTLLSGSNVTIDMKDYVGTVWKFKQLLKDEIVFQGDVNVCFLGLNSFAIIVASVCLSWLAYIILRW